MKSAIRSALKPLLLVSLMAASGFAVLAQTTPANPPAGPAAGQPAARHGMMHNEARDPAKMQERMAKRQADLKEKLKITAAQEGAWTTFTSTMKPPADMGKRRMDMHAEMDKLTTPERIDKMRAMRATRDTEMDKRADAVKTFYAVLTPEQKKVFDSQRMGGGRGRDGKHGEMHGRG
jgi:Spy/CpxP family protein refolding chaperone